jgi:hypothetical protein
LVVRAYVRREHYGILQTFAPATEVNGCQGGHGADVAVRGGAVQDSDPPEAVANKNQVPPIDAL